MRVRSVMLVASRGGMGGGSGGVGDRTSTSTDSWVQGTKKRYLGLDNYGYRQANGRPRVGPDIGQWGLAVAAGSGGWGTCTGGGVGVQSGLGHDGENFPMTRSDTVSTSSNNSTVTVIRWYGRGYVISTMIRFVLGTCRTTR